MTERSSFTIGWPVTGRSRRPNVRATVRANDAYWPNAAGADERVHIAIATAGCAPLTIERTMALESVEQARAALGCGLPHRTG